MLSSICKCIRHPCTSVFVTHTSRQDLGTWTLSKLSTVSVGRVQPVLDIDNVIHIRDRYEDSIIKRNMSPRPELRQLPELYAQAIILRDTRDKAQKIREENSAEITKLLRERTQEKEHVPEIEGLKEKSKTLRDQLRTATADFNVVNDKIIDLIISLPNVLDPSTPPKENETLKVVPVPDDVKPWTNPPDLEWTVFPGVGPSAEFPRSKASLVELELAGEAQGYLLDNKFTETGNVDLVQNSLFDASGMDPTQFIRIREPNVNPIPESHASYLVGGASFPAFLALFAQSLVKNPNEVMPIRYFVVGRSYGRKKFENVLYQRSAVQVLIACRTEEEMNTEFDNLSNLVEQFLSRKIGIPYSMELVSAPNLHNYEAKKVVFLTDDSKKTLSSVSAIGDYVSKRLLCCYAGSSTKRAKFMHLVTGRFLNLTDFIRPLEIPLNQQQ